MTEIHHSEPVKEAGDKPVTGGKGKDFFQKYKILIFSGVGLLLVVLYFMMRNSQNASNSSSGTGAAGAQVPGSSAVIPSSDTGDDSGSSSPAIDPVTGYIAGSPADIAALGGSTSVASTPTAGTATAPAPVSSTNGSGSGTATATGNGPGGTYIPGYTPITFAMAQALAGKSGSSKLYYGTQNGVVQGKYANDPKVQYYIKSG